MTSLFFTSLMFLAIYESQFFLNGSCSSNQFLNDIAVPVRSKQSVLQLRTDVFKFTLKLCRIIRSINGRLNLSLCSMFGFFDSRVEVGEAGALDLIELFELLPNMFELQFGKIVMEILRYVFSGVGDDCIPLISVVVFGVGQLREDELLFECGHQY